jgi:hypothetical protein
MEAHVFYKYIHVILYIALALISFPANTEKAITLHSQQQSLFVFH